MTEAIIWSLPQLFREILAFWAMQIPAKFVFQLEHVLGFGGILMPKFTFTKQEFSPARVLGREGCWNPVHSSPPGYALNWAFLSSFSTLPCLYQWPLVLEENIPYLSFFSLLGLDLGVLGTVQFCVRSTNWGKAPKRGILNRWCLSSWTSKTSGLSATAWLESAVSLLYLFQHSKTDFPVPLLS